VHQIVSADREISPDDVQDVLKNAKAINRSQENHVIHAIRQHFLVDGQDGISDPVGMFGSRMEVDVHVVHGNFNRLQNSVRAVKGLQLEVDEIVFNGLASSLALLTNEQKELGALVIDIGGGTTDYAVYSGGVIKHVGVLAVGGDHVSHDLAIGLKVPLGRAEQLKCEKGNAIYDRLAKEEMITIPNEFGFPHKNVSGGNLRRIMSLRIEEIFQLIAQDMEQAGVVDYLRAGVFLSGGTARTPQIAQLAEQVLGMPVTIGKTNSISGLKSALDQPEFATAIGLVKFGSIQQRKRTGRPSFVRGITETVGQLFRRE
jgi:cell division protein FtsA